MVESLKRNRRMWQGVVRDSISFQDVLTPLLLSVLVELKGTYVVHGYISLSCLLLRWFKKIGRSFEYSVPLSWFHFLTFVSVKQLEKSGDSTSYCEHCGKTYKTELGLVTDTENSTLRPSETHLKLTQEK